MIFQTSSFNTAYYADNHRNIFIFFLHDNKDWAPIGEERFVTLAESNFFEGCRAFRVLPGFIVQFGKFFPDGKEREMHETSESDFLETKCDAC